MRSFYPIPSLFISAPFYGYLKLLKKLRGKERSRKKNSRSHLGIELWTSHTEGCPLTNCSNPFSFQSLAYILEGLMYFFFAGRWALSSGSTQGEVWDLLTGEDATCLCVGETFAPTWIPEYLTTHALNQYKTRINDSFFVWGEETRHFLSITMPQIDWLVSEADSVNLVCVISSTE